MRRLANLLFVCPLCTIIGCSGTFMPMGDFFVSFDFNMPADYRSADFKTYICMPDQSVCGRRRVDEDEYDLDILTIDYGGDEQEIDFVPSGSGNTQIEAGLFNGVGAAIGEDAFRGFAVNDLPFVDIDIPPRFQITQPPPNGELSLASITSVRVEWSPANQGFPMQWKLFPLDNELEVLPCDALTWGSFAGDGDDTGFLEIPLDVFPSDLPPEGCQVAMRVSRIKSFGLPEGVKNGYIHSTVIDGIVFRVMP